MPRNVSKSPVPLSKREERYLHCTVCNMSATLMLAPEEERPTHRCQPVYLAKPFDVDLPGSQAPKGRPWFEEKERHPRPGAA
jgi:hypothetical protein